MMSVTATKPRNIRSAVVILLVPPFGPRVQLADDLARHAVVAARRANVQERDDPGHEELREREQVGDVNRAEDFAVHELWRVAHEHGQREVVDDEEDGRRDDESYFLPDQLSKTLARRHAVPVDHVAVFV